MSGTVPRIQDEQEECSPCPYGAFSLVMRREKNINLSKVIESHDKGSLQ